MEAKGRPRALAVISDLPWPPGSGNHWRYLQNLRLLEAFGYDVGVVAGDVRRDVDQATLGEWGQLLDVVPVAQPTVDPRARLRRVGQLSTGLLSREARDPWAQQHRRAGFDDAVLRAAAELKPHAVLLRSTFSHLAARLRSTVSHLVIDAHDSDALYARMLQAAAPVWRRPALGLRRINALRAEDAFRDADELWVPARREHDYFRQRQPGLPCLLVPNGVPVAAVAPVRDPDGRTLLLFGAFGLPMNLAAADALVDNVLPAVLDEHPECRVMLAGTGLPASRIKRWRYLPVEWLGRVDDLQPLLSRAQAFVFVPPAVFGSGTPLKVSEALAAAIPVVTTPVIGDEIGLVSGISALVDSDYHVLAKGISRLLSDGVLAADIGTGGHRLARQFLSFESVLASTRADSVLARNAV